MWTRLAAFLFVVATCSAADLQVNQYDGPTECDTKVAKGNFLKMHYTGTIDQSSEAGVKGKKFDSSRDRGSTFDFAVGTGQVIQGWDQGLMGLCKGAKVVLVIPPELGYGDRGAGADIPGGAILNFDVEVVDITEGPVVPNLFEDMDTDGSFTLTIEEISVWWSANNGGDLPGDLYEKEDKNGDGVVDWDEFSGPKGDAHPGKVEEGRDSKEEL
jgi:FK506-binding protein 14